MQHVFDGQDVRDGLTTSWNVILIARSHLPRLFYDGLGYMVVLTGLYKSLTRISTVSSHARSPLLSGQCFQLGTVPEQRWEKYAGKRRFAPLSFINRSNVTFPTPRLVLGVSDQKEFNQEMRSDPAFTPQRLVRVYGGVDYESADSHPHSW